MPSVASRRTMAFSRNRRPQLMPPRRLIAEVGDGDFVAIGDDFAELFRRAGLEATDDVLDVGCGAGRMARPLAGWLGGRYEGFDVQARLIRWCRRQYARHHPNFGFTHVDVANDVYNPSGRERAAELHFPYPHDSFDFAILTSVFTHLMGDAVLHYLDELARVMRPGGTVFGTWFLLDREVEVALDADRTELAFPERNRDASLGEVRMASLETPSAAVAYDLDAVRTAHADRGLAIREHWPGSWVGRPKTATWQDVLVGAGA